MRTLIGTPDPPEQPATTTSWSVSTSSGWYTYVWCAFGQEACTHG